jgi:hypothetical protein
MLHAKVFIVKGGPVDGLPPCAIAFSDITALRKIHRYSTVDAYFIISTNIHLDWLTVVE